MECNSEEVVEEALGQLHKLIGQCADSDELVAGIPRVHSIQKHLFRLTGVDLALPFYVMILMYHVLPWVLEKVAEACFRVLGRAGVFGLR